MGDIVVANDGKKRDDKSSIKPKTEPETPCDHQHSSYPWMACSCSTNASPTLQKESRHQSLPTEITEPFAARQPLQEYRHTSLPGTQSQALVPSLSLPGESSSQPSVSSLSLPEQPQLQGSRNRSHSASQPEASVSNVSLPREKPHKPVFIPPPQHYGRSNSYLPLNTIPSPKIHVRAVSYQQPNIIPSAVQQYGRPISYQHTSTVIASQNHNPITSYQESQTVFPIAELEGSPAPPSMSQFAQASRPQSVPLLSSSFANYHPRPLNHHRSFMSTLPEPQPVTNTYLNPNFHSQIQPYSPSTVSSLSPLSTPATTYLPTPIQTYASIPPQPPIPTLQPYPSPTPTYVPMVPTLTPIQPQHLAPLLQEIQNVLLLHFLEEGGCSLTISDLKAHATQALQQQLKAPIILQSPVRDLETERCEEFERVSETVGRCLESMGIEGCVMLVPELGGGGGLCGVHVFPS